MRILIATGIFAPESGGPATYAAGLAAGLVQMGDAVTVLTYSPQSRYDFDAKYPFKLVRIVRGNKLFNRIRFFFAVMRLAHGCDVVYTLDWFAAGVPVALACKVFRKKYIVRVGGDYIWEQQYLPSGQEPCTLKEFYERDLFKQYPNFFRIIHWVLSGAEHVVFNSDDQRELYEQYYTLATERVTTIENPMPSVDTAAITRTQPTHEIVFWGRLIVMKNVSTLVRAFAQAKLPPDYTLAIIGEGPEKTRLQSLIGDLGMGDRIHIEHALPYREALVRVKDARAFILPSWTDIAPNQVYEALAIGLPTLVTKENYLSIRDQLPETIDPHSVQDIMYKLEMLADDSHYQYFAARFRTITLNHAWDDVVREYREVFGKVTGKTT